MSPTELVQYVGISRTRAGYALIEVHRIVVKDVKSCILRKSAFVSVKKNTRIGFLLVESCLPLSDVLTLPFFKVTGGNTLLDSETNAKSTANRSEDKVGEVKYSSHSLEEVAAMVHDTISAFELKV